MMCDLRGIASRLHHALERVYEMDGILLEIRVHERTIGARLAMYLQEEFPSWDVDCEYNRDRRKPKVVLDRLAYPDVIVHRRDTSANLLAVELKGHWNMDDRNPDYRKLLNLTGPDSGYTLGAHVELEYETYRLTWYAGGEEIEEPH